MRLHLRSFIFLLFGTPFLFAQSNSWAQETFQKLTLEEKVSQLFSNRAFGRYWSHDDPEYKYLVELVEQFKIGGIAFFQGDPVSQAMLINDLQKRAKVPLWIGQDMEFGVGMRVANSTVFPPAMALGATRNPDLAYRMGKAIANEARVLGVHQNYAPVADVNNNPLNPVIGVRSFGEKPDLVSEMVVAYQRGLQENGVMATAKHFPGHGDTSVDSHADLPVLNMSRSRFDAVELAPFKAALNAGIQSIMVGHLALPFLEKDLNTPATLSPEAVTKLLREELGFKGLIVSDGLGMHGVAKHFSTGEIAVRALAAGVDQLLLSEDPYLAKGAIMNALQTGRIAMAQLDAAVMRILQAKENAKLHENRMVKVEDIFKTVMNDEHIALATEIAQQSLTLLKNERQTLPIRLPIPPSIKRGATSCLVLSLNDDSDPKVGDIFYEQILPKIPTAQHVLLDGRAIEREFAAAFEKAKLAKMILVPTYFSSSKSISRSQMRFIEKLKTLHKPIIQVVLGSPYSILKPAAFSAILLAYSANPISAQVSADALFGEMQIKGKLPVTIPNMYEYGAGLDTMNPDSQTPNREPQNALVPEIDSLIRRAIANRAFPGAAIAIGNANGVAKISAYGTQTYSNYTPITEHSKFDLASLTKVIATTSAVMKLYEEGKLRLEDRIIDYVPEFGKNGKDVLTIRHLMTHTGGLKAFYAFYNMGINNRDEVLQFIYNDKLYYTPGSKMEYSDLDMIMMGLIVEKITGKSLDQYLKDTFWMPLQMNDTGFHLASGTGIDPLIGRRPIDFTSVPTEIDNVFRKRLIQGEVHDECAWVLGGTAGHAGLFSSVHDLAIFAQMYINGGVYGGKRYLKSETIDLFIRPVDPDKHTRALGWDTKAKTGYSSAGTLFGARSFGHTGFTGTSIWFDPDQKIFAILLTNRVHPSRENQKIRDVRSKFGDLAFRTLVRR